MATISTKFEFYACNVSCHDQNCMNPREVNLFLAKYLAHRPQLFTFFFKSRNINTR